MLLVHLEKSDRLPSYLLSLSGNCCFPPIFDIHPLEKYHILVLNIFPVSIVAAADITDVPGKPLILRRFDSIFRV